MTSVYQAGVRRMVSFLLAFVFLFSVCAFPALADEAGDSASDTGSVSVPEPSVDFYVYDEANVLSAETKNTILTKNAELNEKYGVQIVVMTVAQLPGSDLESRASYLTSVIREWKIGGEAGNGLILALSIADEDYVAVAGDSFKQEFTNAVLKNLLNEQLEPDFKDKAYDAGVAKFFSAAAQQAETYAASLAAASAEPSAEPEASAAPESAEAEKSGGNVFLSVLKFLGIFLLILLALVAVFLIVVIIHGQMVRKKRREARRRRAQQRGGTPAARRPSSTAARRSGSAQDDDYRAFMNRYK
ncbi:MAG: TPM domain-containing protein [Hominenteromicrobium sp.]